MIELTVQIEEKDGQVWCKLNNGQWKNATDGEREVFDEDFVPLFDNDPNAIKALKFLNGSDDMEDDEQLELGIDLDDDPFDDEEFDNYLDDWDDGGLVIDNQPEEDSFF